MSAYIVDRHHVAYLAKIAATKTPHLRHWFNSTKGLAEPGKLALAFANILAKENFRSVYHRYPDTDPDGPDAWKGAAQPPGAIDAAEPFSVSEVEAMRFADESPAQIVAAVNCYAYQACESDDWTSTDAFRICAALYDYCARKLAEGQPVTERWGAPYPIGMEPTAEAEIEQDEEAPVIRPAWFIASEEIPDEAARARAMLKRAGYTQRQVSVRRPYYGSIVLTIRTGSIDVATVHEIAESVKRVRICEFTGEVLQGGNTYTRVEYTPEAERELAAPFLADSRRAIAALRAGGPSSIEEVGTTGVRVEFDGHGFEARAGYNRYWLGSDDERAAQALALYIATLKPEA